MPKKVAETKTVGTLYVVATPIGNLEDLTPRARRILGEVDGILCEDTRMTAKLLNAASILRADGGDFSGRLSRLDRHSDEHARAFTLARIEAGETLALVSDAGTPAISDPGAELVTEAARRGLSVVVIPGVSALTAFLSGAGFKEETAVFRGFFPRKKNEREAEIGCAEAMPFDSVFVWFESPERVVEVVEFLSERLPDAQGVLAKELTKMHERFYYGNFKNIVSHIHSSATSGEIRGEWVLGVVFPARAPESDKNASEWMKALRCLLNSGVSPSQATREISQVFGISRNLVYAQAIAWTNSRET